MFRYIMNIIIVIFTVLLIMKVLSDISPVPVIEREVSYDSYIDVNDNVISLDKFQGNYMWVDYAAEWCSYCAPQTRTMKALDRKMGDQLLFVTVMSSTKEQKPPTADTARKWAKRFNLNSEMVLAKYSSNKLPYHLLYSPSGEVLFQGSGLYNESKIRAIIKKHVAD